MKYKIVLLVIFAVTFVSSLCYSSTLTYCKGSDITQSEGSVLQNLVPKFVAKVQCSIGNNCLNKWIDNHNHATKFSIAWEKQCGPVINNIYQLGDQGKGSTFVCETKPGNNKTCCWPLGYDYNPEFVMCTP